MPNNVLPFPTADYAEIPLPLGARPGDKYLRADLASDLFSHGGIFPGAVFVILIASFSVGLPHLVTRGRRPFIAQVVAAEVDTISIVPWGLGGRAEACPREELTVVGAVAELYPIGLKGPRLSVHTPHAARPEMEYPLIKTAAI